MSPAEMGARVVSVAKAAEWLHVPAVELEGHLREKRERGWLVTLTMTAGRLVFVHESDTERA